MRRLSLALISSVSALAFTQIASAADLPRKAPAYMPPPPVFSWTGFYIGANAGYAYNSSDFSNTMDFVAGNFTTASIAFINALGTGSAHESGFTGGVQIGYNWQASNWVLGIEADINYLSGSPSFDASGTTPGGTFVQISQEMKPTWIATLRPRIGYAFDRLLVYGTGGLAVVDRKYTETFNTPVLGGFNTLSTTDTSAGWVAGGGVEYAFGNNWSAKAEYLYASFGDIHVDGNVIGNPGFPPNPLHGSADLTVQMVRAGLNFHF